MFAVKFIIGNAAVFGVAIGFFMGSFVGTLAVTKCTRCFFEDEQWKYNAWGKFST